jgi:hypothetical protein
MTGSTVSFLKCPMEAFPVSFIRLERSATSPKAIRQSSNSYAAIIFMQVVMLLITFYSEVEGELTIGVASDLKYVWQMLIQHNPFSKEIYDRRGYASRLT